MIGQRHLTRVQRLALEEEIRKQVTDQLRLLAADPHYRASPVDSRLRSDARKRMLARIRSKYPDATANMLQRALTQVARDLAHCPKKD